MASMARSSSSMRAGSTPGKREVLGEARCAPTSKRSICAWCSCASAGDDGHAARATPMNELSSSTVPYASIRGSFLATRAPPNSAVWPASPVRV
jgi:hypothetical protein